MPFFITDTQYIAISISVSEVGNDHFITFISIGRMCADVNGWLSKLMDIRRL